jgi:pimeloyl-ACP methyl ester carboxylesterase
LATERRRGRGLLGFGVVAAGAVTGAALEELVYRRFARTPDPEKDEPIGAVPGRTSWVEADDGTRLYTRTYGPDDAPTAIVFVHGIVENHVIWHYVVRNLRTDGRHKLVAYDARGHGNSGPVRGPDGTTPFDADTLGRDLAAVIEQTTTGPVVVVGHSLGGMTALTQLAADRKERERVAGAVLMCTTYTSNEPSWRGRFSSRTIEPLGGALRRFVDGNPKRADRLRLSVSDFTILAARTLFGRNASLRQVAVAFHMFETTPSQTLAAAVDLLAYDVEDHLAKIDIPVLVIGGERDLLTPAYLSRHMAEAIPEAELAILEGCGHMAPFERHEEVTALIRKFADRVLP